MTPDDELRQAINRELDRWFYRRVLPAVLLSSLAANALAHWLGGP